jgi:hypothetical protein
MIIVKHLTNLDFPLFFMANKSRKLESLTFFYICVSIRTAKIRIKQIAYFRAFVNTFPFYFN